MIIALLSINNNIIATIIIIIIINATAKFKRKVKHRALINNNCY
jgi:hypothetical protein